MNKKNIILAVLLFGLGFTAFSQKTSKQPVTAKKQVKPTPVKTGLQATYYIKNNRIMLRWAPVNEESFRYGNKYGYVLERRTIVRDDKLLSGAEQIQSFRSYPFIKDSLVHWEKIVTYNDNAAVMAQAIYGESFEVDINKTGNVAAAGPSLLSKAEENKQRFLFALYAADNDFNVATRAGLGFVDTSVKTNEKYFYRIYSAAPKHLVKKDTALLFVSFHDIMQLPQTAEIYIEPSNKSMVLSWDMERTKAYYNSFIIQRSDDDGKTFRNITRRPYSSMGQGNNPYMPNSVVFVDTAVQTGNNYKYRVSGINIFGERGPWSAIAQGKTLPLLEGVPGIQGIRLDTEGQALVNWYFEDSIRQKIKGFELTHSPTQDGIYKKIIGNIDAAASEVKLPDSLSAGYLIVKAVSKEGISRTSFPYLYQPEDSIPPAAPIGITAKIDTTGKVELKWLPNSEKDLQGYKVFRTMIKGTEHAVLVDTIWTSTTFYDTLDLKLKNRKVYYTVTALDFRSNQSTMSKEIEVVKPDVIPPTPPVFSDYKLKEKAVELNWINSDDEDLAAIMIQRKNGTSGEWKTIFQTQKKDVTTYNDIDPEPDKTYSYRLMATDEAGLQSPEGQVLTLQTLPMAMNRKVFKEIASDLDRDKRMIYLRWETQEKSAIKSIEVFRASDKDPLQLYKVLDGKTKELLDNELIVNTKYKYGLRALLTNGQYSEMMIKEVNY